MSFQSLLLKPIQIFFLLGWFILLSPAAGWAVDYNCFGLNEGCTNGSGGSRSRSAPAANSSRLKINPSEVPTDAGFGVEGILYRGEVDFSLVRGNGRVGAAISPSNSESTFFGPPSVELEPDYFERKYESNKYPGQKITLATAIDLVDKNGSGLKRYALKIGLMAKYNRETKETKPGGGISGVLGPFTFGYSVYADQTKMDYLKAYGPIDGPIFAAANDEVINYDVKTYSFGFYLSSLILDYSNLQMQNALYATPTTVNLYTASLIVKSFLLTVSRRVEKSETPYYNYETKMFEYDEIKEEHFGGIQYNVNRHLMVGLLYNYYLLREYSATLTLFF